MTRFTQGFVAASPEIEAAARRIYDRQRLALPDQESINAERPFGRSDVPDIFWNGYRMDAEAALAPLLAAHQQVAAERDEARERVEKLEADVRAAVVEIGNQARARGEAEGALRVSEMASIVDGWRVRALAAEAALATANAELARRQKALLLLLPFVDYAAGEGLMFVETEDGEHPEMDAADIVIAAAKEIGLELGSDASEAFLAAGYDAIRAARAATAREG